MKYAPRLAPTLLPKVVLMSTLLTLSYVAGGAAKDRAGAEGSRADVRSSAFAFTPNAIWSRGSIVKRLGLESGAIYRIESQSSLDPTSSARNQIGMVVGDPDTYRAYDARASAAGGLVAFHGTVASHDGEVGIGVLDAAGALLAFVPGGIQFAWSPRGTWLAVARSGGSRGRAGLLLWNSRKRSLRTVQASPSRVGWIGEDSLLVQLEDRVAAVNPGSGSIVRTGHHGTVVSPDRLYSMWPGEGGRDTQIIEDRSGRDITDVLFDPLRRQGLREIRSAFWVHGGGSDHLMCVSGTDDVYGPHPHSKTAIIDAESGEMIALFPGEAIGPTADGTKTVVLRHGSYHFEAIDLEDIARHWIWEDGFY